MTKEKDPKKKQDPKEPKPMKPGEIRGKLEIPDLRERRDGPGGN